MKNTEPAIVPVCVAGAHRSGTSMLTRLLHELGLDLGPANELMPPQADNPDGFWENLRFVAINDEVLTELGGAWDLPPIATEDFQDARLDPLKLKAQTLIDTFSTGSAWGWKDPRNSLTLPFWNGLLPQLKVVVMVRNPLEVAYSMHKRNGTSYAFGLRLWDTYNRRVLTATEKSNRLVSNYDAFFKNPEAELRRIARFAGLPDSQLSRAISLISKTRRHTSFTFDQLVDARVAPETIELFRDLIGEGKAGKGAGKRTLSEESGSLSLSKNDVEILPGPPSRLRVSVPEREEVREELAALRGAKQQNLQEKIAARERDLMERIAAKEQEFAEVLQRSNQQATELGSLGERFRQKEADAEALRRTIESLRHSVLETTHQQAKELGSLGERFRQKAADAEALRQTVHQQATELGSLRERFREKEADAEALRQSVLETTQVVQSHELKHAEYETRVAALADRLRQRLHAAASLAGFLDRVVAATTRLRTSRRWKLGNPVAALRNIFAGRPLLGPTDLERTIAAYRKWRDSDGEMAEIERELRDLTPTQSSPDGIAAPAPGPSPSAPESAPFIPPAISKPIRFTSHQEVDVSIVIPFFNQVAFTQACLASIQQHSGSERFEVIAVDDSSTDLIAGEITKIEGLIVLRNETNLGFIASSNLGAKHARGRFLVFLNNDTLVTAGWLSALRETFDLHPRTGLVGAKLLFPDGRLQEAGGIVWRDATAWNYGRFDDPAKPKYNFLREVDYCSGACLMIQKSLFEELGGFDVKYAPAYYEDIDLAFKVRDNGFKVLYQPLSSVIHVEGATSGTDLKTGAKRFQEINRGTFATTWARVLADKPVNGDLSRYRAGSEGVKSILVIDHHIPTPDRDAGSLRMFHILKILRELEHQVTFIPDNLADMPPYTAALQKLGIEVIFHPHLTSTRGYLENEGKRFDVAILSRCDVAQKHIADVRAFAPQSRIIFDTVDLHFLRQEREADLLADPEVKRMAQERRNAEFDLIERADQTWVVSDFERDLLRRNRPAASIEIVSTVVDFQRSATTFSDRDDLLFVGSFQHPPNADAVLFFAQDIFPLILQELPTVKFYVIGDKVPPTVAALESENIIITGWQPDLKPYFDRVKLSVAPLRYGAGVKGKINQSLSFGVPVVATSLAVEGMALQDGHDVLVADAIEPFAQAVVELCKNETLWTRLSENGVTITEAKYSSAAAKDGLVKLMAFDPSDLPKDRQSAGK